jgi:hypothetical protein
MKKERKKIDNFSLSLSTHNEFEFEIVLMELGRLHRWVMGLVVKLRSIFFSLKFVAKRNNKWLKSRLEEISSEFRGNVNVNQSYEIKRFGLIYENEEKKL